MCISAPISEQKITNEAPAVECTGDRALVTCTPSIPAARAATSSARRSSAACMSSSCAFTGAAALLFVVPGWTGRQAVCLCMSLFRCQHISCMTSPSARTVTQCRNWNTLQRRHPVTVRLARVCMFQFMQNPLRIRVFLKNRHKFRYLRYGLDMRHTNDVNDV